MSDSTARAAGHLYEATDLRFSYPLGNQLVPALRGVSLAIPRGGFVCLSGPSGSGKSTLLSLLGLIEPVQEGSLRFDGRDLKTLSETERNGIRKMKLGFVFQSFQLFPVLDAAENVEYFLQRQGVPAAERAERVREALESVGLWEHRAKKPLEMSGGQRQRVAIARAFAKRPDVVIADEPTASLDQATGRSIMELLRKMNETRGVSVVLSSHDPMVLKFAPTTIHLQDGVLC